MLYLLRQNNVVLLLGAASKLQLITGDKRFGSQDSEDKLIFSQMPLNLEFGGFIVELIRVTLRFPKCPQ